MPDFMLDVLSLLPLWAENTLIALALLLPAGTIAVLVLRAFDVGPLLGALLRRQAWISGVFIVLIAVSVGIGVGLIAQERGIREGTARAADKFELIVAAPGSEFTAMLAAVYLQPSAVPLLDGSAYARVANHPRADLVAPLAFGDSFEGAPVVGSTPQFVAYLGDGLAAGRIFENEREAVVGARVTLRVGDSFVPQHGTGETGQGGGHEGYGYDVVGRMPMTGTPWDRALIVPVESVWSLHGLVNGHSRDWDGTLGPPFDPDRFPGTPAALVKADSLGAAYGMQAQFNSDSTMAFFPGTVLSRLHALMGDVRQVMSILAIVTQVLVTAGVLAGLMMLTRLLSRRLALLQALGAPRRFIFAITWSFAATLIAIGAGLGIAVGLIVASAISSAITAQTDILVSATLGWREVQLVAGFISLTATLALLPAWLTMNRPVVQDLRG